MADSKLSQLTERLDTDLDGTEYLYIVDGGVGYYIKVSNLIKGSSAEAENAQTGTTYTLVLSDQFKEVSLTNASAITLTVPTNASVAFPIGTVIILTQGGAGQVTVTNAGGVTIHARVGLKLAGQYASARLKKNATNTWTLTGDLSA